MFVGVRARLGPLNELCRSIKCDDFRPPLCKSAGIVPIAAGGIKHTIARLQIQKPIRGRHDEFALKVIAFANSRIPPRGNAFPCRSCRLR